MAAGLARIRELPVYQRVVNAGRIVFSNKLAQVGGAILLVFLLMVVFGPTLAPHDPAERQLAEDGGWHSTAPPSIEYPLGTTDGAYPIFSQLLYGARSAMIAGLLTAIAVGTIGTTVGIVAGYYGGWVDNVLMRIVDITYGTPFLPFAIILVLVLGSSIWNIIIAISVLAWRGTARVIRSAVITMREQTMIDAAESSGASNGRILVFHILPKVLPLTVLYAVFAVGWAILTEAGLSFLGFGDPNLISWGQMLQAAYTAQALDRGLWAWIFVPGLCIMLLVMSLYFIAQGIEELVNPELREA
jgi:peptide/nickel transport system permease protein